MVHKQKVSANCSFVTYDDKTMTSQSRSEVSSTGIELTYLQIFALQQKTQICKFSTNDFFVTADENSRESELSLLNAEQFKMIK